MGRGRSFPSLTRGPRHFPTSFLASYSRLFTLLSLGDRSFAPSFMLHFRHSTSLSPPSSRYETRNDECNEGSDEASNRHGNRGPVHEERCEGKRNGPNLCFLSLIIKSLCSIVHIIVSISVKYVKSICSVKVNRSIILDIVYV